MSFSILIPTLNEEKYIGILLEALAQQTYQDFEVIIVDANSADGTRKVIDQFSTWLNLRVYQVNERGKIGMQRNFAASKAKSELLVFFDADVRPAPCFLQTLKDSVELQRLEFATCWNDPISHRLFDKILFLVFNIGCLTFMQHFSHAAVATFIFVKKDAFDTIGGFDEDVVFAEDYDLTRRLGKRRYKFGLIRGLRIPFSVRRLERDGKLRFIVKMLKGGAYFYVKGSIKSWGVVQHEFGMHT
jgi:glycosyltransferase involved in cell wall biosynthesis